MRHQGLMLLFGFNHDEAVRANVAAVEADRAYFARVGPQGIYEFYN